ncbi:hypothetical protein ACJMK2_005663 [Sinanodonta woodiana]|uniref:Cytochrome P450 n=1 Tax=Sinanodonta woodiana TaxID=1069815 RepID=A0ABD3VQS9_SINWO
MAIPGPKPNFLFGNLLSFWRKSLHRSYQDWAKEYGKTFGYFEGPSPVLVTSDVDLLHEVLVKNFKKFHARKVWPVQVDPDNDEDVHMFFARGERWRRLRSIANPAFSTVKMRQMSPLINQQINNLIDVIGTKNEKSEEFNIYELLQRLTLDTIAKCGFGLEANSVEQPNDEYLENCRGVINDTTKRPILFMFGFLFPALHSLWINIYYFLGKIKFNPVIWLEKRIETVINERKQQQRAPNKSVLMDLFLQSEWDPHKTEEEVLDENKDVVDIIAKQRFLSTEELRSQCLLFLLSGYETTSTAMAYLMYEMAANPDMQQKLQEEIDQHFQTDMLEPGYDTVMKMEYLDMVWCETLRKYPLASTVVARQCTESTEVGGMLIPEGMVIQANIWDVHYNSTLWGENTHRFDPERFREESKRSRHPMAWIPFGGGPRTCVGLRLAQLEGKMTVVRVFKEFTLTLGRSSQGPLEVVEGATIFPKNGVHVKALRR